jgi:hypothetical protein
MYNRHSHQHLLHVDGHKPNSAFTYDAQCFTIIRPYTCLFTSPISTTRLEYYRHKNPNTKICLTNTAISKTCIPILYAKDTNHLEISPRAVPTQVTISSQCFMWVFIYFLRTLTRTSQLIYGPTATSIHNVREHIILTRADH